MSQSAAERAMHHGSDGLPDNVTVLPGAERREHLRIVEALLFASAEPVSALVLASRLPEGADIAGLLEELKAIYSDRGVNLCQVAGGWAFRTADDLGFLMQREALEQKRLSRAALETMAIIAYHQPVTRAEIEAIRGVATSKGTLDMLLEIGWIRMRGRRRTPGRPVTYGTTPAFLDHFGLDTVADLPGLSELKGAGLLSSNLPGNFQMPDPSEQAELTDDEDPLEDDDPLLLDPDRLDEAANAAGSDESIEDGRDG